MQGWPQFNAGFSQLVNSTGFWDLVFEKLLGSDIASNMASSGLAQGSWEEGLLNLEGKIGDPI